MQSAPKKIPIERSLDKMFDIIEEENERTFKGVPNQVGTITFNIVDSDEQVKTIAIIVKES